ncbi:MAG: SDR family oxidoreductase [Paracoccaceae bacterium]
MHVLITGANRGIGAALAQSYVARGDTVSAVSRDANPELRLDVTSGADQVALAKALQGRAIDVLVCNAGVYLDKGHSIGNGYDEDVWAQSFAVNVTGVFKTIENLLPNLRAAKTPKIAIISSRMASQDQAPGGSYVYRASKAAVLNLGRNLSVDLKPQGIAVGIYHPGWVQTDMGGTAADIAADTAAAGLVQRFDALSLDTTGCFQNWDGQTLPY